MRYLRSWLQTACRLRRAAWRRYRRVPGLIRWPVTLVLLLFLAVILANVIFGAGRRVVHQEARIRPEEAVTRSIQVDAGRNVEVIWNTGDAGAGSVRAALSGPDERQEASPAGAGAFTFKGGFARSSYALHLANEGDAEVLVRIRWTIR